MHWDGTVTLGNVLATLVIVGGMWKALMRVYGLFDSRLDVFEKMLTAHTLTLTTHSARMDRQEQGLAQLTTDFLIKNDRQAEVLTKLTGEIQRVVGRMEAWRPGQS